MAAADAVVMTCIVIAAVKLCVPEKAARLIHGTAYCSASGELATQSCGRLLQTDRHPSAAIRRLALPVSHKASPSTLHLTYRGILLAPSRLSAPGMGRPTKRDRRHLDRTRGRRV
jgi:hypothetical protein